MCHTGGARYFKNILTNIIETQMSQIVADNPTEEIGTYVLISYINYLANNSSGPQPTKQLEASTTGMCFIFSKIH